MQLIITSVSQLIYQFDNAKCLLQNHISQLYRNDFIPFEDSTFIYFSDLISSFQGQHCRQCATSFLVNVNCIDTTIGYNQRMTWCEVCRAALSFSWSVLWEIVNQSVCIFYLVALFIKWVFCFILVILLLSQPLSFKELIGDFTEECISLPYQRDPFEESTKAFLIVWDVFYIPSLVLENKADGIKSIRQIDKNSMRTLSAEL